MKYLFEIIACAVAFALALVIGKLAKLEKEANKALDELKDVVTKFVDEVEDIKLSMNDSFSKIKKLDERVDETDDEMSVNKAEIYALMKQLKEVQNEIETLNVAKNEAKPAKKSKKKKNEEVVVEKTQDSKD